LDGTKGRKKWYFCQPAAKFTIVGEIWVSYNPLEKEETNERLTQKMTGKRRITKETTIFLSMVTLIFRR